MRMLAVLSLLFVLACANQDQSFLDDSMKDKEEISKEVVTQPGNSLTFLALGDSYTIGESVPEAERWPVQLKKMIVDSLDTAMSAPRIVAKTGWTTNELQDAIDEAELGGKTFDFVSLLIGVNNQYRGYSIDQYKKEFPDLLDQAIEFAGGDTTHVFVVSIPDYGVTPFGKTKNPEQIAQQIDEYNDIAQTYAESKGVTYFDITPISREAADDATLIADDGLHPSGKMYARWVKLIYPWMSEILDQ